MKNQHLGDSQVVVCKIRQPPLSISPALLPAISFHLLRVILAILLPIVRVRPAPLPGAVKADLLIHRIAGDLLPTIIVAAFALACGLAANHLLRMIRGRPKGLLTVTATTVAHHAAPREWQRFILSGSAVKRTALPENFMRRGLVYRSADLSARNRDTQLLGCTLCITIHTALYTHSPVRCSNIPSNWPIPILIAPV
ncbi:MAG: hypothetical protein DMG36_26850, partial [Acidobacteria bacterium]